MVHRREKMCGNFEGINWGREISDWFGVRSRTSRVMSLNSFFLARGRDGNKSKGHLEYREAGEMFLEGILLNREKFLNFLRGNFCMIEKYEWHFSWTNRNSRAFRKHWISRVSFRHFNNIGNFAKKLDVAQARKFRPPFYTRFRTIHRIISSGSWVIAQIPRIFAPLLFLEPVIFLI